MTKEPSINELYQQLMDKLGIVSQISGSKSAYDPNIPFSHYDMNYYNIDKFEDGSEKIYERIERISYKFAWVDEILTDWGYSVKNKNIQRDFPHDSGYDWNHPNWNLKTIQVNYNPFHMDMFQIKHVFGYSNNWETINTKEEMKNFLDKCVIWQIERSNDKQLLRGLRLRQILK